MEEKTTVPVIKTNGINEIEINDNTKISFLELGKKKVFKTSEEAKWVGIDVAYTNSKRATVTRRVRQMGFMEKINR